MLLMLVLAVPSTAAAVIVKRFVVDAAESPPPIAENTYLVYDESSLDAVLVDPGGPDPRIASFISQSRLVVRKILNTHGHLDHIRANEHFARLFEAGIAAPAADRPLYDGQAVRPDDWLKNGDRVSAGTLSLRVIATPGHTPGSCCYSVGELLLTGDSLFKGGIGKPAGASDGERRRNEAREVAAIRDRLLILPAATLVLPGHGSPTTIWDEATSNLFLK
jgi:glyoxylase-like metal-dependent hydrolase (beta-lactamase superfamily II)